jgi:hypothetical protein
MKGPRVASLPPVRAILAVLAAGLALASCGPLSPTEEGGAPARPLELLEVLPSPGELRGPPAAEAGAARLQRALTGAADAELAGRLEERGLRAAAVRSWSGPGGQELVAAVSVWGSHLIATGIGADAAGFLLDRPGASPWTPSDVPGSRGARVEEGEGAERRLSLSVGPNSLYVRSRGPVPEETVVTAMRRLRLALEGQG